MLLDEARERKQPRRYTFVVFPENESSNTRTFSASLWGIIALTVASFLVIIALVTAIIVYTPIGSRLPIGHAELEQQYGRQIQDIEEQLHTLFAQMDVLRVYNLRLRLAMGENLTSQDSALLASRTPNDIVFPKSIRSGSASPVGMVESPSEQLLSQTERRRDARMPEFPFTTPTDGFLTQSFDPAKLHFGIDYAGKQGTPILAAADGNVVFSGWTYDDGNMMMLAHDLGYMTVYKHTKALLKTVGMTVKRGEMIALLGNTGRTSSGPHLHFEVWRDGSAENPVGHLLTVR